MKSQDILILLKLVALERREAECVHLASRTSPDDASSGDSTMTQPLRLNLELDPYSVRELSSATGISKSEVSNALGRCYESGLAKPRRQREGPLVNRRGLEEFLSYGVRYVFPGKLAGLARGIPTGLTAPIFGGELKSAGDQMPVWPDPRGDVLGVAVEPLYKTVPIAIRNDDTLYKLLAIVDSIRTGQPRERKLAVKHLQQLLDF